MGEPSTSEAVVEIRDPAPSRHGTHDRLKIRGFKENYACPRKTPRQISQMLYERKLEQRREKGGEEERQRVKQIARDGISKLVPR